MRGWQPPGPVQRKGPYAMCFRPWSPTPTTSCGRSVNAHKLAQAHAGVNANLHCHDRFGIGNNDGVRERLGMMCGAFRKPASFSDRSPFDLLWNLNFPVENFSRRSGCRCGEMVTGKPKMQSARPGLERINSCRNTRYRPKTGWISACSRCACGMWITFAGEWSGRRDSNSRPPVPKTGALPGCATPRLGLHT